MSDLINRLREGCGCNFPETTCMAEDECRDAFEAAAEIERLTAALAEAWKVITLHKCSCRMFCAKNDPSDYHAYDACSHRRAAQWLEKNP